MFSIPTAEAKSAILAAKSGSKITITKFQMGMFDISLPDLTNDPDFDVATIIGQSYLTTHFDSAYEGPDEDIKYNVISDNRLLLKCMVPAEFANTFNFNSILVFAQRNGTPFIFSLHFYNQTNPKFNIEQTQSGMKYYFLLTLDINVVRSKFDLANLTEDEVTFIEEMEWFDLPPARHVLEDQGVLYSHVNTPNSNPHVIFNSMEQWYGTVTTKIPFDGQYRDIMLPILTDIYPIPEDEIVPEGYEAMLYENGDPVLSREGDELMIKTVVI